MAVIDSIFSRFQDGMANTFVGDLLSVFGWIDPAITVILFSFLVFFVALAIARIVL